MLEFTQKNDALEIISDFLDRNDYDPESVKITEKLIQQLSNDSNNLDYTIKMVDKNMKKINELLKNKNLDKNKYMDL